MRVTRDKRGWQRTLADDNIEHDDAWLVELQLEELRAATQLQDGDETDGQHTDKKAQEVLANLKAARASKYVSAYMEI